MHTLGTLLEGRSYKKAIADGNIPALLASLVGRGQDHNPLSKSTAEDQATSYDGLNRDSGQLEITLSMIFFSLNSWTSIDHVPNIYRIGRGRIIRQPSCESICLRFSRGRISTIHSFTLYREQARSRARHFAYDCTITAFSFSICKTK